MIALWDTSGDDVVKALSAERRNAGGVASGLALTLVGSVDERRVREAETAAATAAAAHPCRLIIVVRSNLAGQQLAVPRVAVGRRDRGRRAAGPGRGGRAAHARPARPARRVGGDPAAGAGCADSHLVARRAAGADRDRPARRAGGAPDHRRGADSRPGGGLFERAEDYAPGDTDLAWTRTTPWRSLLASCARHRLRHGARGDGGRRRRATRPPCSCAAGCRAARYRANRASGGERHPGGVAATGQRGRDRAGASGSGNCPAPHRAARPGRCRSSSAGWATSSPRSCAGSGPTGPTRAALEACTGNLRSQPQAELESAHLVRPGAHHMSGTS